MSFLKKLFGGKEPPKPTSEDYKGYRITPQPMTAGPGFRICAVIEKEVSGELLTHTLIRADTLNGFDEAREASSAKARQVIDQQGDRLFQ